MPASGCTTLVQQYNDGMAAPKKVGGVRAEAEAERALRVSHRRFLSAATDTERAVAGRDLIQAVFGEQAVAENQVR